MMYNKTVQDCFFAPRHVGRLDTNSHLVVCVTNHQAGQGTIEFYMQCQQDMSISRVCYKTNGNPYLVAGLEWLSRQLEGQSIEKILQIDYQVLIKELDIPVAQYPLALRIIGVFKEILVLMKNKLGSEVQHS